MLLMVLSTCKKGMQSGSLNFLYVLNDIGILRALVKLKGPYESGRKTGFDD